jgi:GDPmannose 4,6-dehydratase
VKRALILGVSGQDGAYLSRHLLSEGYEVHGTSRDAQLRSFRNLERLGVRDQVKLRSTSMIDFRSIFQTLIEVQPDEIYNLAGQSSVGLSFEQPVETLESMSLGTLNTLEAVRLLGLPVRIYNACSSESFGDTGTDPADEFTPFRPRSPYAIAKAAAFWQVSTYREAYDLYACSGILFNHESPLRPSRFVTQKIVSCVDSIARGELDQLRLGNLHIARDWGWAPDYVVAMWKMLQLEEAQDFVIATGESHRLEEFVRVAFECYDLDWRDYVVLDKTLLRPSDLSYSGANPAKAKQILGWSATYGMHRVVREMVDAVRNPDSVGENLQQLSAL